MKQLPFFVINVGNELAAFAKCPETINCLSIIVSGRIGELDKAESKEMLAETEYKKNNEIALGVPHVLVLVKNEILDPVVVCSRKQQYLGYHSQ